MRTRTLGPFTVSAIGLGAMPLSMVRNGQQGWDRVNETVHAALGAGVTFIDSSGLRVIASEHVAAAEAGGTFRIVGASDRIRRIFEMTGLETLIET